MKQGETVCLLGSNAAGKSTTLRTILGMVRARSGRLPAAAFVVAAGLATGFGIYLGRFLRLNTWDVATRPLTVLEMALSPFSHPLSHPRAWVVTVTFALFFLAAYGVGRNAKRSAVEA